MKCSFFLHQIIVIDTNRSYACFQYGHGDIPLALLREDEHYDALTSLSGLLGRNNFCPHCLKRYDHLGEHACPNNKANHSGACLQEGCTDHTEAYKRYR